MRLPVTGSGNAHVGLPSHATLAAQLRCLRATQCLQLQVFKHHNSTDSNYCSVLDINDAGNTAAWTLPQPMLALLHGYCSQSLLSICRGGAFGHSRDQELHLLCCCPTLWLHIHLRWPQAMQCPQSLISTLPAAASHGVASQSGCS